MRLIPICVLLLTVSAAVGGESKFAKDFRPQPVKFPAVEITLKDAIAQLQEQTGNPVIDLRKVHLGNPKLLLKPQTYWETLDALGREYGIGCSPYHVDGATALIDSPYRQLTTHYSGAFRFAFKRISVTRDDETQTHYAQLAMELAWEPRLRPLYVNLQRASVVVDKKAQSIERQSMKSVAGNGATEIDFRMAAPPRTAQKIKSISGEVRVIAAPSMTEFTFDKLKPLSPDMARDAKEQAGIKVRLLEVRQPLAGVPWKVRMLVAYPDGALVPLDSFQSCYNNNKVWLSWFDAKTGARRTLETTEQYEQTKDGWQVTMTFAPNETTPLPPANANVTLHLRTPSRVTEVMVPFEFRDLPLP